MTVKNVIKAFESQKIKNKYIREGESDLMRNNEGRELLLDDYTVEYLSEDKAYNLIHDYKEYIKYFDLSSQKLPVSIATYYTDNRNWY